MPDLRIYKARKIVTMNPQRPEATHVAVRGGRIVAVGDAKDVEHLGVAQIDTRFAEKVILPGFVEGHSHLFAGSIWTFVYIGYYERTDPDGRVWSGLRSTEAVVSRMKQALENLADGEPLIAWGFDPIYLEGPRADRKVFDLVSTERCVAVIHSNFHLMTVNSRTLNLVNYTADSDIEGIVLGEDGHPNGELHEMAVMFPIMRRLNIDMASLASNTQGIQAFGRVCNSVGVTTATDLAGNYNPENVATLTATTGEADFPIRLVCVLNALLQPPEETVGKARALQLLSTDRLRLGAVKIITDGSIQGFTARMRAPGYLNGASNGLWNIAPDQLALLVDILLQNGVYTHIHVNGDEAIQVAIDAIDESLTKNSAVNHRTVLQHCQLADHTQFRKMADLNICANLFSNHIYYFGDQHRTITIGQERAERMNGCRSALDFGIPIAIHSDAPITPLRPLTTAWAAVMRQTAGGEILGADERISPYEALHAITLGPAYTLHLDHEIGSIEPGKQADFAIVEDSPLDVSPQKIKDIDVWGTVIGGSVHPAQAIPA